MADLVEECFFIKPNDIIKALESFNNGNLAFKNRTDITFWLDEDKKETFEVNFSVAGSEPRVIDFDCVDITFGERAYFICPSCSKRVNKLYLPSTCNEFKCCKCHKLRYFLNTFNKNSVAGIKLYEMNRRQKLAESRASMSRILYRGEYSRRFLRFLNLCNRAGLSKVVDNAKGLMDLVKG